MAIEIIDLTEDDSPDYPPSSPIPSSNTNVPMIPNFGVAATANHNLQPMIHPHQTAQWQAPHTYDPSLLATRIYPGIHVGQVTTVLEPVPESNILRFPIGVGLRKLWTQREHELFLMGIIKFGIGRWSEIARHFVWSKTPQQIQIYAASFFGRQATTFICDFMIRNPLIGYFASNGNHMTRNRNLMDVSASFSMPMIVANETPLEPVTLFQENAPFPHVPSCGNESSSNNITYGGGPITSMTASDDGEIDLELRLG